MTFDSHLTFIQANAIHFPERLVFKVPQLDHEDDDMSSHQKIHGWTDVTYQKFYQDIVWSSGYWLRTLQCPPGSVVGLWFVQLSWKNHFFKQKINLISRMLGMVYRDVVHFFGLMNAGFVPQILTLKIRSAELAIEYFKRSDISYIIYAPTAPVDQLRNHFQIHEIIDIKPSDIADVHVLSPKEKNGDDTVLIFHSSGSTSGKPKLIPYTHNWIHGHAQKPLPGLPDGKEIGVAINGIVHASQFCISLQQFRNGTCIVLIPWLDLTGAELCQIITECKANVLYQLTPILTKTLREAMKNSELRAVLKSLNFIACCGSVFGESERLWSMELGIPIKNWYGMTEMGITMVSAGHDPIILHPINVPGLVYEFKHRDTEGEVESTEPKRKLVEAIISSSSIDRPYPTLCDPIDGHFHTRDLFEEVGPNGYIYRERLDDIIKMSRGQKCSAFNSANKQFVFRFIESQILLSCESLVAACVVVGSGKPSPVLVLEPLEEPTDIASLKEKIGKKAELINKDGFPHERIRPSDILIVPSGTIPRTPKGNINRSSAERLYKQEIDAFFDE
ncbi:hypothetical protein Clacol_008740 [Clathrus columnatus]|uniref:AMP-dependent synthetase/ligase domain-containing protein n=1 Tax=Clathrus columnatus TaxID=1419009 RepID=A0AAV5AIK4_9AGAM|nr:hypothetical protein Clacol_008740 [Clathrus columnatus]